MSKTTTEFISAANVADYNTSHYIHLPVFQEGMLDEIRRDYTILNRIPAGRWGTPNDMKGLAIFLSSSASNYINGAIIPVDGGYLSR